VAAPRRDPDEVELAILEALSRRVMGHHGWRYQGVEGWVLGVEAKRVLRTVQANHRLVSMRNRGLVCSADVYDPTNPNLQLLWRITQAGENDLARLFARAPRKIPHPAPDEVNRGLLHVFLTQKAWSCLAALQRRTSAVSWTELRYDVQHASAIDPHQDDVRVLLRRGLAVGELRDGGPRKQMWFSPSDRGRHVRLVDGSTSATLVQVSILLQPADETPPAPDAGPPVVRVAHVHSPSRG
jgi:hypothetical protein